MRVDKYIFIKPDENTPDINIDINSSLFTTI